MQPYQSGSSSQLWYCRGTAS